MRSVLGFASEAELDDHFFRHRREFHFTDKEEYQAAAIEFLSRPLNSFTVETLRTRDDTIIRYNKVSKELAYLHSDGHIGSYYIVQNMDGFAYYQRKCK